MNINYPPAQAAKAITNEGSGSGSGYLTVTAPMTVNPGSAFLIKLAVLDDSGLALCDIEEPVTIEIPGQSGTIDIPFKPGAPALAELRDAVLVKEGFHRIRGSFRGQQVYSNPVYCSREAEGIFFGDPHIHTALSNCNVEYSRSCTFSFYAARYLSCLDWMTAADHVSGGRSEPARWKEGGAVSDLHNDPPDFVTIPGYEASLKGGAGGDNNVYLNKFPRRFVDQYEEGDTLSLVRELKEYAKQENFDFFIVPHHTTRTIKHGEIPPVIYPGPERMPLVEIHSKWGTSEYRGNPTPLKDIHPGPSYALDLLQNGYLLGFAGGTDTHSSLTFGTGIEPDHIDRPAGITGVLCESLTRENVFRALKNRSCYACKGERIYLKTYTNGASMGSVLKQKEGPRVIAWKAAASGEIAKVELIRNGEVIYRMSPGHWFSEGEFEDRQYFSEEAISSERFGRFVYYYLRLTCTSGAMAWSSPVWVR
ncbi:MAG: DUF3604 domain-containing protein [Spirochaetia bacterium]